MSCWISAVSFDGDMTLWDFQWVMWQRGSPSHGDPATVEEIQ